MKSHIGRSKYFTLIKLNLSTESEIIVIHSHMAPKNYSLFKFNHFVHITIFILTIINNAITISSNSSTIFVIDIYINIANIINSKLDIFRHLYEFQGNAGKQVG